MQVKLVTDGLGMTTSSSGGSLTSWSTTGSPMSRGRRRQGARSGAVAGIVIALVGSPVLVSLVTLVQSWLTRQQSGTVVLEIAGDRVELTGKPTELHQEALTAFLARHSE